jgi:CBS domain-containing protein
VKIEELMTGEVVAVDVDTPLKDVAATLVTHRISGLPVVDSEYKVLGVLSEADILMKEQGLDPRSGGGRRWLLNGAFVDARLAARTAGEAMTTPAITISPGKHVSEAARLMTTEGVKRLPVVDRDDVLIGIVTRADLVRAFARTDAQIEHEILDEVVRHTLWIEVDALEVSVDRGDVVLAGEVERRTDCELLERFVARVPGVVSVHSTVEWKWDDRERMRRADFRVPVLPQV